MQIFAGFVGTLFGAFSRSDPAKYKSVVFAEVVSFFNHGAPFVIPISIILVGLIKFGRDRIGSVWAWNWVKTMMDDFRNDIFANDASATAGGDRVTLFRYRSIWFRFFIWPRFQWLCAVERSGHVTRDAVWWRCKKNGKEVQGIAGQAFFQNKVLWKANLPQITEKSVFEEKDSYAVNGFVSQTWVDQKARGHKNLPRSLCGIPVQVKNEPWGVIVIDSQNPVMIEQGKIERFFRKNATVMSKVLEKV